MKAGRELDALIAEKVMGFDKRIVSKVDGMPYADVLHYSTQIADAWLVVEKFPNVAIFGPNDSWLVRFSDDDGSIYTHPVDEPARADTAPLAICLAALKAVDE
jgi:hypothetical protein